MSNDLRQEIYKTIEFIKRISKNNPDLSKSFILTRYTKLNKNGYRVAMPNINEQISLEKLISQRIEDVFRYFDWYDEDIKSTNIRLLKYIEKYIEKREKLKNKSDIDQLNDCLKLYIKNYLKNDNNFNKFMKEFKKPDLIESKNISQRRMQS